jgi:4-amino-4-deoxychorismate lyase|tara:strand:- start:12603 stop:13433 length:831 start_codon:yes stop_codon:yes gene_type:complete
MLAMQIKHTSLVNGSFSAPISPLDRGFAYGDGVFRTIKIINGLPEHWPMHYQTLFADCSAIGIVCPSADTFISDFKKIFDIDEFSAVVKIIVTRGEGERGYNPPAVTTPMRVMIKSSMPDYPEVNFSEGVVLHLCDTRIAHQPKLAGIKHLNRLDNVLARMEWHDPKVAEGVMLDMEGNVIECTAANIVARYGDTLITPKLDQCGVAGITRKQILAHAKRLELNTAIERMNLKDLHSADEVVICNSLFGAWQVRKLAGQQWAKQSLAEKLRKALHA